MVSYKKIPACTAALIRDGVLTSSLSWYPVVGLIANGVLSLYAGGGLVTIVSLVNFMPLLR